MVDLNTTEMSDQNVTFRMLYITIVIVALFVTFGIISTLHEHGIQDIPYPFYPSHFYGTRQRRDVSSSVVQINVTGPKHYRLPKDYVLDELSNITLSRVYWFYINTIQTRCKNITSISNHDAGGKICAERLQKAENNCLVYSIADDFDFKFESSIKAEYKCEVHAIFSPRVKHGRTGKDCEQIGKHSAGKDGSRFPRDTTTHHLELTEKSCRDEARKRNKMFVLIRKAFPKPNEFIDVLKIDIDGGEWKIIPRLIEAGFINQVKQIVIELHFGWGGVRKSENLKILRQLYSEGFRIVSCKHIITKESIENITNMTITNVNEITFLNIKIRRKKF